MPFHLLLSKSRSTFLGLIFWTGQWCDGLKSPPLSLATTNWNSWPYGPFPLWLLKFFYYFLFISSLTRGKRDFELVLVSWKPAAFSFISWLNYFWNKVENINQGKRKQEDEDSWEETMRSAESLKWKNTQEEQLPDLEKFGPRTGEGRGRSKNL